jgi:hypothetical protein
VVRLRLLRYSHVAYIFGHARHGRPAGHFQGRLMFILICDGSQKRA